VLHAHIPEISKQDILVAYNDDGPVYVPRKTPLTLRMLLSHTSGLAYARRNTLIQRWQAEHNCGKPGDGDNEVLGPLVFEPRTRWRYGTGVDWAGILLERVTGQSLGAWMSANIFQPLGITSLTFEPGEEHEERLLTMCFRPSGGDGPISIPPPHQRPQGALPGDKNKRNMRARGRQNGGGGLYGTARDYLRFLSGVLASRDAAPGEGILSREMFDELFKSSLLPRGPETKAYADCAKSMLFGTFTDPRHTDNDGQGLAHSVGFMLNTMDSVHGRRAFSGCWDGAAKSEYWIDPTTGIAVGAALLGRADGRACARPTSPGRTRTTS
jgi:CubicO group peptidase (beta-lactamase class C family)